MKTPLFLQFLVARMRFTHVIGSAPTPGDSSLVAYAPRLDQIHYRAALIVSGCIWGANTTKVLKCLGWMSLEQRMN
jgi:hypothetical protein